MKTVTRVVGVLIGLIALLVLILVATQVGGIAIRNDFSDNDQLPLSLSLPAVRGAKVSLRWPVPAGASSEALVVLYRDLAGEQVIGTGLLTDGQARVVLPCGAAETGSLVLLVNSTQQVVGQQVVELLPPGADCVLR